MVRTRGVLSVAAMAAAVALGLASACSPPTSVPIPPSPPGVFLTIDESNIIGTAVKGKVSVSGCKAVTQVQLLQQDAFLTDLNYNANPTEFSLPSGLFSALYPQLGIAAALTLKAKVICDDQRTNTSVPVGIQFFPISSRSVAPAGQLVVPNNFVAEGGLSGTGTTFLGCTPTDRGGTKLTRVNAQGVELAFNEALPFDCTLATQISERSQVTGTRWVLEPGRGAYAINDGLVVLRKVTSLQAKRIGVGPKGSAAIWLDEPGTLNKVVLAAPVSRATDYDWSAPFVGIMNSNPVVDDGAGAAVWVTEWVYSLGTHEAHIFALKLDLNSGALINTAPNILSQQYPTSEGNTPIPPKGVFNADGTIFTMPLFAYAGANLTTTVLACGTSSENCDGLARRWTSPGLAGEVGEILPFSEGNIFAAIGPTQVYFLNGQTGTLMNPGEKPLRPSGSQRVQAVLPGRGADFYVLTGPDFGATKESYPTEIIATESPGAGELWRLQFGSGESSNNSVYLDVDDSQQVWVRAGSDLLKLLPNSEYRQARGPTPLP